MRTLEKWKRKLCNSFQTIAKKVIREPNNDDALLAVHRKASNDANQRTTGSARLFAGEPQTKTFASYANHHTSSNGLLMTCQKTNIAAVDPHLRPPSSHR